MFSFQGRGRALKSVLASVLISVFVLTLWGCSEPPAPGILTDFIEITTVQSPPKSLSRLKEMAPPDAIQALRLALDRYQPQVSILNPAPDQVIDSPEVAVEFQVNDYPLFKDETLGLGPHVDVFVDDQFYQAVYDTEQPLLLRDLEPGTHTIRAFASRPWHESFKNEGAYAQTTFHVYTETGTNEPKPQTPLLTYSRPQGTYGAEPILVDFYLTDAPLHFLAQEDAQDQIEDWRIRCTINGESFLISTWEPIYLAGFEPGLNWVKLELLDQEGQPLDNAFNPAVRLIHYQPGENDTLSQLVRGDLSADEARSIIGGIYPEEPTLEEPIEELTEEPVESADALIEEPTEKPTDEPIDEPIDEKVLIEETVSEELDQEVAPNEFNLELELTDSELEIEEGVNLEIEPADPGEQGEKVEDVLGDGIDSIEEPMELEPSESLELEGLETPPLEAIEESIPGLDDTELFEESEGLAIEESLIGVEVESGNIDIDQVEVNERVIDQS